MKTYVGICLTGPLDGQVKTFSDPRLKAGERPRLDPRDEAIDAVSISYAERTMIYEHHEVTVDGLGLGFWLPSGWSTSQAMQHIAGFYIRNHARKSK